MIVELIRKTKNTIGKEGKCNFLEKSIIVEKTRLVYSNFRINGQFLKIEKVITDFILKYFF